MDDRGASLDNASLLNRVLFVVISSFPLPDNASFFRGEGRGRVDAPFAVGQRTK